MNTVIVPTYIDIDESLCLRQLSEGDAPGMFSVIDANRDHLEPWLSWVHETHSPEDSLDFILGSIEHREEGTDYQYGIFWNGDYIGNIGLHNVDRETEAEIGYWVASSMTGRGIATKSTQALLALAFDTLELPTIRIRADERNQASNRVIEKCGFSFIEKRPHENEDRMLNVYKMMKEEWNDQATSA